MITIGTQLDNYYYYSTSTFPFLYGEAYGAVFAPFWSRSDQSKRISSVGYEVHISDGGEESANLLQRVSSFISNSSFLKSRTDSTEIEPFSGTWMAVVHWDKLIPFNANPYDNSGPEVRFLAKFTPQPIKA